MKEINHDLYPTRAEAESEWYTKGIRFFNWYVVIRGGLFEDWLRKRAELRAKMHKIDNEVPAPHAKHTIQDRLRTLQGICNGFMLLPAEVNSLRSRVHKLETIIRFVYKLNYMSLVMIIAYLKPLFRFVYKLNYIHLIFCVTQYITRKMKVGHRQDKLYNVDEKEQKELEKVIFAYINITRCLYN